MKGGRSKAVIRARLASQGIVPRGLALAEAAAYCELSETTFLEEVTAGRLPRHLPFGCERRVWDRRALDAALDRLASLRQSVGPAEPDEEAVDPYMAAIENA